MSKKKRPIPVYQNPIIETHCHLDYLKNQALEQTLEQAKAVGVERFITISVSVDNLHLVREIATAQANVWCTQGIHPHEAESYSAEVGAEIRLHQSDDRVLAVGEIGLDYYYENAPKDKQRAAFEAQLQIAVDTNKPVVIHSRDADQDTIDILKNFSGKMQHKGVIHSFTSGLALAQYCLSEGFCLGFNGISTFNKADNVREVIAHTPVEQILLETDAPFLTPVPYRGKENAPCYLPFIAETVANIKDLDVEEFLQIAYENSMRTFFKAA